jgi:hypothetical protein
VEDAGMADWDRIMRAERSKWRNALDFDQKVDDYNARSKADFARRTTDPMVARTNAMNAKSATAGGAGRTPSVDPAMSDPFGSPVRSPVATARVNPVAAYSAVAPEAAGPALAAPKKRRPGIDAEEETM